MPSFKTSGERRNEPRDLARNLSKQGVPTAAKDNRGSTPLHYAAMFSLPLTKFFADNGCSIDEENSSKGATVDQSDGDRNTALMYAARNKDEQWCRLLLEHGADPDIKTERGHTPRATIKGGGLGRLLEP